MSRRALIADLYALTKPRIVRLNIFMCGVGIWLAPGSSAWTLIALTIIGTSLAVASANALNMFLERDYDLLMERTADRPLPARRLNPRLALAFGLALGIACVPVLLLVNTLTTVLAVLALGSYVCVYTPLKRKTPLALLVGAIPGAMPPLMGWTAVTGALEIGGVTLFLIVFLWQVPHFLAIALYYKEDYARAGIRTVPNVQGDRWAKWQALSYAVGLVLVSISLVPLKLAGPFYLATALVAGSWFIAVCLRGFSAGATTLWARKLFIASLVYLPVLCIGLIVDVTLL